MKGLLQQINPVLPVKNVKKALEFYVKKLGFQISFTDDSTNPFYAGIKRDAIEIHLQWHDTKEWESRFNTPMLRIRSRNIEALYEEYKSKDVFHKNTSLKTTTWGTREFAFYDLYMNGLTFYQDL